MTSGDGSAEFPTRRTPSGRLPSRAAEATHSCTSPMLGAAISAVASASAMAHESASTATIAGGCEIGPGVTIGPGCVLEEGVRLSNCVLLEGVRVCTHAVRTRAL